MFWKLEDWKLKDYWPSRWENRTPCWQCRTPQRKPCESSHRASGTWCLTAGAGEAERQGYRQQFARKGVELGLLTPPHAARDVTLVRPCRSLRLYSVGVLNQGMAGFWDSRHTEARAVSRIMGIRWKSICHRVSDIPSTSYIFHLRAKNTVIQADISPEEEIVRLLWGRQASLREKTWGNYSCGELPPDEWTWPCVSPYSEAPSYLVSQSCTPVNQSSNKLLILFLVPHSVMWMDFWASPDGWAV